MSAVPDSFESSVRLPSEFRIPLQKRIPLIELPGEMNDTVVPEDMFRLLNSEGESPPTI